VLAGYGEIARFDLTQRPRNQKGCQEVLREHGLKASMKGGSQKRHVA